MELMIRVSNMKEAIQENLLTSRPFNHCPRKTRIKQLGRHMCKYSLSLQASEVTNESLKTISSLGKSPFLYVI